MLVGLSIKARIWSEERQNRFDVGPGEGSMDVLTYCEVPAMNVIE